MWSNKRSSPPAPGSPTEVEAPAPVSSRQKNPGRRIAQIVKLKPEFIDKYKEVHANVWPEVLKQIKECNIVDCRSSADVSSNTADCEFRCRVTFQS